MFKILEFYQLIQIETFFENQICNSLYSAHQYCNAMLRTLLVSLANPSWAQKSIKCAIKYAGMSLFFPIVQVFLHTFNHRNSTYGSVDSTLQRISNTVFYPLCITDTLHTVNLGNCTWTCDLVQMLRRAGQANPCYFKTAAARRSDLTQTSRFNGSGKTFML